jgi:serine protease Do
MKKVFLIVAVLGFTSFNYTVLAQDEKPEIKETKERKETQEIIIRKKGDKNTKIIVEIKGDKVTINGKPISEFKDGDITINKRDVIIGDKYNNFSFSPFNKEDFYIDNMSGSFPGGKRAFLGVTTGVENEEGVDTKPNGAAITNVSKGSAAEKAGLKEGDIITKINSKKVDGPESLSEVVNSFKPKEEVTVYYKRDGKENSSKAVLGESKISDAMAFTFSGPNGNLRSFTLPRNSDAPHLKTIPGVPMWNEQGMQGLKNFEEMEGLAMFPRHQKLGLKIQDTEEGNGVKVLDAEKDSPAEKAGLKKDDIVTEIGGKKINNTDDAREQLMENAEKALYNIKAKRNGSEMSFDIKIPKKLKTANL